MTYLYLRRVSTVVLQRVCVRVRMARRSVPHERGQLLVVRGQLVTQDVDVVPHLWTI